MKGKNRRFVIIVSLLCAVALVLPSVANATSNEIEKTLYYRNIKININGSEITPKDVDGNTVEPFIIEGTTYLPIRAISSSLGMSVDWDQATYTVSLTGSSNVEKELVAAMQVERDISALAWQLKDCTDLAALAAGYKLQSDTYSRGQDIAELCYNDLMTYYKELWSIRDKINKYDSSHSLSSYFANAYTEYTSLQTVSSNVYAMIMEIYGLAGSADTEGWAKIVNYYGEIPKSCYAQYTSSTNEYDLLSDKLMAIAK